MDFLKRLFNFKEYDPWRQFSREIGAEYNRSWGGCTKVVANVKNWTITFKQDLYFGGDDIAYNTVSAPYLNKDGFQFNIYHKGVFSKIGELLGLKVYMKVGYPEFERDFTIESNNELKVRALLANSAIRQLIQSHPDIGFSLNRSGLFLTFGSWGFESVARLRSFYKLFEETLNQLYSTGSSCETGLPGTE